VIPFKGLTVKKSCGIGIQGNWGNWLRGGPAGGEGITYLPHPPESANI